MASSIKLSFIVLATALSSNAWAQAKVKIGVLTDLSGVYSDMSGPGSVAATQMAVDDFGGKVLGKTIEVVSADHQNKADIASSVASKWFDTEDVQMIVDLPNSACALAVQALAKQKKKISMVTTAATTELTNKSCSDTGFHWTFDTHSNSVGLGKALVAQGKKKWFFITADYNFGHTMEKDTTKAVTEAGGSVVGSVSHPFPSSDFSSFLLKAAASKADVVALANAGADTINAIKQAREFGVGKGDQKLAALVMFITDIHALGLKTAQGLTITDAYYWDLNAETRAFGQRFFKKTGAYPAMGQAGAYSATLHYLRAVQKAGTLDAAKVAAQIRAMPVNDFFAKNGKVRADGRLVHDMYLMQVKSPEESKAPWDYQKLLSVVPGDQAFQSLSKSECPLVKK
jgi:branched-chain amino acid transport system substrate-binding protein